MIHSPFDPLLLAWSLQGAGRWAGEGLVAKAQSRHGLE